MSDIHTPVGDAPVLPLILMGAGGLVLWFGVHYWRDTAVKAPQDVLKSVLQGKGIPSRTASPTVTADLTAAITSGGAAQDSGGGGTGSPAPGGTVPSPGAGGTYNTSQLESLWVLGGGNPAKASGAACIAMHESSGEPKVTSPNPGGGTNVGLWQLDTPGGKGAGYTVSELQNPVTNAQVAVKGSSDGTDWSAWSTAGACGL